MREKIEVSAIRDRDLRDILQKYQLSEKMVQGKLSCESCSQIMSWENTGALIVKGSGLIFYCNLPECIDQAATRRR
jgi:hypothetical protein